jgi:hypothetical protein
MYTKKEFYSEMKRLFTEHFGEDYKQVPLRKIKKALREGAAPDINFLYKDAVYDCRLFGGEPGGRLSEYNIWDYERLNNIWKHI